MKRVLFLVVMGVALAGLALGLAGCESSGGGQGTVYVSVHSGYGYGPGWGGGWVAAPIYPRGPVGPPYYW